MLDRITDAPAGVRTHDANSPYLTTHRAGAACTRELNRLHDAIAAGVAEWHDARAAAPTDTADPSAAEAPVIRRSPARCLVQVGPVALTLAWLQRTQSTVADGELLVVVWRGTVATHTPRGFERVRDQVGARSATALWETVLVVSGDSETAWGWAPADAPDRAMSSATLADRCVERLRAAHAECLRDG